MPGYSGTAQATLLRDNQQAFLWQAEVVAAGALSVAFEIARVSRSFYPWGMSFEVVFSANPGVFEIDIMGANNDIAANYLALGSITATNNASSGAWVGRWDLPANMWPKYVAAYIKTLTNAVSTTLQVTR